MFSNLLGSGHMRPVAEMSRVFIRSLLKNAALGKILHTIFHWHGNLWNGF